MMYFYNDTQDLHADFRIVENFWLNSTLKAIVALLATLLNLAMLVGSRSRTLRKTKKGIYLSSLAAAGLLTGLVCFIYNAGILLEQYTKLPSITVICHGYIAIRDASLYVGLLHMVLFSLERWRSVHHPFRYIRQRSKTKALVTIATIWVFGFVVHTAVICYWSQSQPSPRDTENPRKLRVSNDSQRVPSEYGHLHDETGANMTGMHLTSNISQAFSSNRSTVSEICLVPYAENIAFTSVASALQYTVLVAVILLLNLSAYIKALSRKKLRIRRSVSSGDSRDMALVAKVSRDKRSSRTSMEIQQSPGPLTVTPRVSCDETIQEHTRKSKQRLSIASSISAQSQSSSLYNSTTFLTNTGQSSRRAVDYFSFAKRGFHKRPILVKSASEAIDLTARMRWIPQVKRRASSPARTCSKGSFNDRRKATRRPSNAELAQNLLERQDRNAACWLLMLTLSLLAFFLPHRLLLVLNAVGDVHIPRNFFELSVGLYEAIALLNPLLYGFCNAMFRRAFREKVSKKNIGRAFKKNYTIGASLGFVIPLHVGLGHKHDSGGDGIETV
ncbi:hypothetical protein EGW08_018677 [Elysia chlorotica]|uniref:G-protein coupled receptors family 1 profile domain-containing protein n=1 Tax=Elysia chlorotica TaxID=188477 RepID=A0A433SW70_ELYCH|nr:hypothetical protein EGW08_018677 [Elysia chlorotica]